MNPSSSSTSYWNNPPPPGTEFDVPEDASPLTSLKIECRSNHKSEKQTESSVKYPGTEGERPIERTRYKSRSHSPHHHKRRKRSRSRSKDRHRHSRPHRRRRRYSSSRSRSRSRSPSHRRKRRTKRYSRSRSKSRSRSYSISRSYKSDRDKKYSHSSRVKNDRATQKKKQDDLIKPAIIKEEIEEEEEDDDDEEQTTPIPFKNDGSFLEMFKKMQEEKIKEEAPDTEAPKKPILPAFGKRRGGKVLKTGLVQKVRNIEEDDSSKGQDAWSVYMNEVKKYKEACCNEDSKTRPLLK